MNATCERWPAKRGRHLLTQRWQMHPQPRFPDALCPTGCGEYPRNSGVVCQGTWPLLPSIGRWAWQSGEESQEPAGVTSPPKPQASAGAPGSTLWSGLMRSSPGALLTPGDFYNDFKKKVQKLVIGKFLEFLPKHLREPRVFFFFLNDHIIKLFNLE